MASSVCPQDRVDTNFSLNPSFSTSVQPSADTTMYAERPLTGASSRNTNRRPQYNRGTIQIEEFINKKPDNITAKEYRVLIPLMFQALLYPDKETEKTKVKGLWEEGNKPTDWSAKLPCVRFRDPNNAPKFKIDESKLVFVYLRDKLMETNKFRQISPVKTEPKTESVKTEFSASVDATVFSGPLHFGFETIQQGAITLTSPLAVRPAPVATPSGDDLGVTLKQEPRSPEAPSHQVFTEPGDQMFFIEPTPPTQFVVMDDANGVTVGGSQQFTELKTLTQFQSENPLQVPQTIPVESSSLSLSITPGVQQTSNPGIYASQTGPAQTNTGPEQPAASQMISVVTDEEGTACVVTTETQPSVQVVMETSQPSEACEEMALAIQSLLVPVVKTFSVTYDGDSKAMEKVTEIVQDVFVPLLEAAKRSESMCHNLSTLQCRLQEMLQRYTMQKRFNKENTRAILEELEALKGEFKLQPVLSVPDPQKTCLMDITHEEQPLVVPEPSNEVQVFCATTDAPRPNFSADSPYIPTIAGLQKRADEKARAIEGRPNDPYIGQLDPLGKAAEKIADDLLAKSLMSPVTRGMEGMNIDDESIHGDPEADHGIKLRAPPTPSGCQDDKNHAGMETKPQSQYDAEIDKISPPLDMALVLNDDNLLNAATKDFDWSVFGIDRRVFDEDVQSLVDSFSTEPALMNVPLATTAATVATTPDQTLAAVLARDGMDAPILTETNLELDDLITDTLEGFQPDPQDVADARPQASSADEFTSSNIMSTKTGFGSACQLTGKMQAPAPREEPDPLDQIPSLPNSSPATSDVFLRLRQSLLGKSSPVIPTVVEEAAASGSGDADMDQPCLKKQRCGKSRSRKTSESARGTTGKHRSAYNMTARATPYN